jgi:hypothetical protein
MRPEVSSTPAGLKVGRRFESGRLARDCQARAYEQILSVAGRSELVLAPRSQAAADQVEIDALTEEGVAA